MRTTASDLVATSALLDAVIRGDSGVARQHLAPLNLSELDPLNGVSFMTTAEDVAARLMGIQCLAGYVRERGDVRLAAGLLSGMVRAFESLGYLNASLPLPQTLMVANVLDACASVLPDAGRVRELLADGPRWTAWLDRPELVVQWRGVQRAWVEACLHAGLYEKANELLAEIVHRSPESRSPIERRLLDKLDDLLRAVDRPDTPSATLEWVLKRSFEELTGLAGSTQSFEEIGAPEADRQAQHLGTLIGLAAPAEGAEELIEAVSLLPQAAHPFHETSNLLTGISDLLSKETLPYPAIADLADRARTQALAYAFWEQAMSLGWLRSIALRRAQLFELAADELATLRNSVLERQRQISLPVLRAALAVYLPHLWPVSADVLFTGGRKHQEELFEVIEGSKARILAALTLERQYGFPSQPAVARVRELLERSRARACYLTVLADREETYGAIVAQGGELRTTRLPVGRVHFAAAAQELAFLNDGEPGSLVREAGVDPDHPFETDFGPVLKVLAPLAQWMEKLFADGVIRNEDVLCVSPDGPLYNLPLAALEVGGHQLLERVALGIVRVWTSLSAAHETEVRRAAIEHSPSRCHGPRSSIPARMTDLCTKRTPGYSAGSGRQ